MRFLHKIRMLHQFASLALIFILAGSLYGRDKNVGELQLQGVSSVEKTSGVWVDGKYVGYLEELKGSKKILLAPGEHQISVRQGGYSDFTEKVMIEAGRKEKVRVTMSKAPNVAYPTVTAEVKMTIYPLDAGVFVDGIFMGHVDEFDGLHGLLVAPGIRKITVREPGYHTFESQVTLAPNQVLKLETNLVWAGTEQSSMNPK
jgi:hypothetical protein